jgi:hypothetical protein
MLSYIINLNFIYNNYFKIHMFLWISNNFFLVKYEFKLSNILINIIIIFDFINWNLIVNLNVEFYFLCMKLNKYHEFWYNSLKFDIFGITQILQFVYKNDKVLWYFTLLT